MSRDFAQPRSLEDQITHRAKYMVDLIDRTTHPWSALLLAVHYVYSSTIGKAGYSPLIVLFSLEFSRLLAPGGDPYYFPCKLADTAVETLQQLWSGIYAPQTGNLTLDLCNSATVLVDLYAFGFLDDTRMMNCLNWLVSSAFESVEHLKCLEVLLERLLKVASSETGGRSLPFDFYDRTFYQDVISAWRISMTKNQEEDCKIKRFSAFAGFCDELTLPWNKHQLRFLKVSRLIVHLGRKAVQTAGSQLENMGGLVFDFDTQVELTPNSSTFRLMKNLMETSKDVSIDDALQEGSIYLVQMYRMIRKAKI